MSNYIATKILLVYNDWNVLHDEDAGKESVKAPTNKATCEIHVSHRHQ